MTAEVLLGVGDAAGLTRDCVIALAFTCTPLSAAPLRNGTTDRM